MSTAEPPVLLRSALYLPASNPRAIAKAGTLDCDAVILDLEDAVALEAKADARAAAVAAVREGGFGHRLLVVRCNPPGTAEGAADLRALAGSPPDAVLVPKVSDASVLETARAMLGEGPALWAMVETPLALLRLDAICAGGVRHGLAALVMGTNDLALELRQPPVEGRWNVVAQLVEGLVAARAHGLAALDGVFNALSDAEGLARECRQGRDLGFDGKTLIHPAQIAPANAAYEPSATDIEAAKRLKSTFEQPENVGKGAIRHEGRMVERLHLVEATRTLARAAAIARRNS